VSTKVAVKPDIVGRDLRGIIHHIRNLWILDSEVPCPAALFAKEIPLEPVTCLWCLCLDTKEPE
jgi:hypothetical protein